MKIVKNKYLVMRALKQNYKPEDAIAWSATARELAKLTGLKENQCNTVGLKLASENLVRAIQTKKTVKTGNRIKNVPVTGFALNRAGALELDAMDAQLVELGLTL
jgi:hypothetical protein